jgi:hypothetical protein
MGRQHGRLLAAPIRALKEAYLGRFLRWWAPAPGGIEEYLALSRALGEHVAPHHTEEIEGIAEGAGITPDEALLMQTFLDLQKLFFCSTFVGRSRAGSLLFGRNLDFPSLGVVHRYGLLVRLRGEGCRPIASISWPGLVGVLSGMNDAGLALAVMVVVYVEDAREGVPYTLLFREILERERDLAGIERRLRAARITNSNNLMAAVGDEEASLFQVRPSGVDRIRDDGGGLTATNHFRGHGRVPKPLDPITISSRLRLRALARHARECRGALTVARARRALRATAKPLGNLQSMIFAPGSRDLWLAMGSVPAARGRFVRLRGEALFGRE